MSARLDQILRILLGLTPQDITTVRTGPYQSVGAAQRIMVVANTALVAAASTVTVQLLQATDASGTGSKALGTAIVTAAPAGGSPLLVTTGAQITDLDTTNGYAFVAVQLSSNNGTAVQAGATMILGDNRFNP